MTTDPWERLDEIRQELEKLAAEIRHVRGGIEAEMAEAKRRNNLLRQPPADDEDDDSGD